eukprot:scaffold5781_cov124-Isochrysis_galbana.AAC.16
MLPCAGPRGIFGDGGIPMTVSFGSEAEGAAREINLLLTKMRWTTGSLTRASMGGRDGGGRTRRRGVDRLLFTGFRGCGWGFCGLSGGVARAPVSAPVTAFCF